MDEFKRFRLRRGTAAVWTSTNPILADGEEGFETDTKKRKVGDGVTAWNALAYLPSGSTTVDGLTDATATGKAVLKAADPAAARTAIGAGTASTKADVGLGNVNNTSDATKPISADTQAALNTKASTQQLTDGLAPKANTADVTAGLAGKANSSHTHGVTDLTATGTKDGTKFLRDDNVWAVPPGGGGGSVPADGSVTTVKIADGATTTPKLADGGVATAKVADDAITSAKVSSGVRASLSKADTALQSVPASATPGITSATWLRAVIRRTEKPVTVVTFADSRGDGTKPSAAVGVGATQLFPLTFAAQLRGAWGLPLGGRGYLPMQRSGADNTYEFAGPSLVSGSWAPVVGDTGIPGSQWIIPVGDGGRRIRIPLQPGCTSVDLISSAPGGGVHYVGLLGQSGASYQDSATVPGGTNTDLIQFTKLTNPGTYVEVFSPGGGWQALGVIEYVGDETSGVRSFNFATAGITANDYATGVVKSPFAGLLTKIAADMTVIEVGINDVIAGRTAAQVVTSVQALLTAGGGEKVVMTTPPPSANAAATATVNTSLRAITATIVDVASVGANTSSTEYTGWFHTDNTHLKRTGAIGYADYLRKAVLGSTAQTASNATQAIVDQLATKADLVGGKVPASQLPAASSGNDSRIKVSAVTLGDGSAAGPYTIQHNFGTRAILASLRQKLFPFKEIRLVDIAHPSINALQIITDKPLPQVEIDLLGIMGTTDVTPPSTATASLVSKTDTSVTLSATATDDVAVTAYNWFRGGSFIGTSLGTANYVSSGLTPNTQYSFTATAVDSSGNESAAQSTAVVVTTNAPTTPPSFDSSPAANSSNGAQSFNYVVPSGGNRTVYAVVSHLNSAANASSASVTCGGTAMTNVCYAGSNGQAWVGVYKRDNVPPGTYSIATSTQENYVSVIAMSYVPVSASTAQTSTGGGSTTPASTSVAVAQNEVLVTVYSCRETPTVVTGTLKTGYTHSSGFQFVRVLEGTGSSPQSTSLSMANAAWACASFKVAS